MKDELYGNTIAMAGLTAALLFFAPPVIMKTVDTLSHHGGDHHGEEHSDDNPLGLAYNPAELVFANAGATVVEPEVDLGTLLAAASADKGARSAAVCKSCHSFEQGGANSTGPNLWNIVGKEVAAADGFKYSKAVTDFGGTWTYDRLDGYLENSQKYIPGTAMVQKIRKEEKRADILAYLQTLSSAPVPFPAPVVPADVIEQVLEEETSEETAPAQ